MKVRVKSVGKLTRVWLDDVERHDVMSLALFYDKDKPTRADLTVYVDGTEVEVDEATP